MCHAAKPWYEESFGEDYLLVYRHRSRQEAAREVRRMLEWLGLQERSRILDLCCGTGRHSLTLADAGHLVTGVDLSAVLLREARVFDAAERVKWIRGDMRDLGDIGEFAERFDAVVNLFTSFGYFEEDLEQLRVLRQIERSLNRGGRFVIDYMNPAYTVSHLVPSSKRIEEGIVIAEKRRTEGRFIVKEIVVQARGRPPRRYVERVKLYSMDEMVRMLREAGLALDAVYGSYEGETFDERTSKRMILIGGKERRSRNEGGGIERNQASAGGDDPRRTADDRTASDAGALV